MGSEQDDPQEQHASEPGAEHDSTQPGSSETENPTVTPIDHSGAPELYCVVTHQHEKDADFWNRVAQGIKRWGESAPVTYQIHGSPIVAQQANYVHQCIEEGAVGVVLTLANPEGMAEAISAALEADLVVTSFNSGAEDYQRLGISHHVSIDETKGGRDAGRRLAAAGVGGPALCVIHERNNIALEERCDGFEETYQGSVERMYVPGVADLDSTTGQIAARLNDADSPSISAILALNAVVSLAAQKARAQAGLSPTDVALATFDQTAAVLDAIARGEILFSLDTLPYQQGWYAMATSLYMRNSVRLLKDLHGLENPAEIIQRFRITLSPYVFTAQNALPWQRIFAQLAEARRSSE